MPARKHIFRMKKKPSLSRRIGMAVSRRFERKAFSATSGVSAANTVDWATGLVLPCSGMVNGTAVNQRIGNSVVPRSLRISMEASLGGTPTACRGRFIVVQDKEQYGVNPTLAQVCDAGALSVASADLSPYNLYLVPARFKILADIPFVLDTVDRTQWRRTITISGKKMLKHIFYQSTGTSDGRNAIYVIYFSNQNGAGGVAPLCAVDARLEYTDA